MFGIGSLIGGVVRVATLPVSVTNTVLDVATGGTGKKNSRREIPILGDIEEMSEAVAETCEEIDE